MKDPPYCDERPTDPCIDSFEIEGPVVELLRGCGTAVVAGRHEEVMLNRGTDGVHFDALVLGQNVRCTVNRKGRRVLFARQQSIAGNESTSDAAVAPERTGSSKGTR